MKKSSSVQSQKFLIQIKIQKALPQVGGIPDNNN
jgi:hypothetical protein